MSAAIYSRQNSNLRFATSSNPNNNNDINSNNNGSSSANLSTHGNPLVQAPPILNPVEEQHGRLLVHHTTALDHLSGVVSELSTPATTSPSSSQTQSADNSDAENSILFLNNERAQPQVIGPGSQFLRRRESSQGIMKKSAKFMARKRNLTLGGDEPEVRQVVLRKKNSHDQAKNPRQRHTLFNPDVNGSVVNGGSSNLNYDIEAVKLDHSRRAWPNGTTQHHKHHRRPSISSEESLSDCEELGLTHTPLDEAHRQARGMRRDSSGKALWDEQEIAISLRSRVLEDFNREELIQAIDTHNVTDFLTHSHGVLIPRAGPLLLLAVWRGAWNIVRNLLDRGVSPNVTDSLGRSCLHLAAITGCVGVMKLLLEAGVKVDCFDKHQLATPLFCAAVAENSEGLKVLLKHGANINAGLHEYGLSALHCAVRANNVENVQTLLGLGAVPNSVQLFSETPLHTAASMGYEECAKLLIDHGACLEVLVGSMKMTALHLAAQDGNTESVQYLIQGGANVDARNARGQSALHLAALAQSPETVELLLKSGANANSGDYDCRTPLHSAIVKGSRSYECVRLLLDGGADVNHKDRFGYSPLHIAALNEYSYCANMLLAYGADITARTNGGASALSMIVRKIPNVLPKFEDMLDHAITLAEHDINDVDCELKLDFRVLIPNQSKGESSMFINFIEIGHNHLLKHPLCESFIHLKWLKVRKFFFVSLIFHLLFTFIHTAFVLSVYTGQCTLKDNCKYPVNETNFSKIERIPKWESISGDCFEPYQEFCLLSWATLVIWVCLLISTMILLGKEIFQLMHSQKQYFYNWENWVQLGIIVNVILISFHRNPLPSLHDHAPLVGRWQHHAAAVGVFLVWGELMLMIGRLPTFGIYVQMFTTVAKNFAKFLAAYFCLLVAFALSFCVLFPNYQSFNVNPPAAIVKTLVMMAGEIEYENFIYENGDALFDVTGHVMIMFFVVLVSIILMNLLVGLAVSDIQGLQKSAGLDRLVRQTELISHIESMLFSRLLHFMPLRVLAALHHEALVVPYGYSWTFTVRPNDLREDRLPREITESVHWLVSTRHRSRKRRPFSRYAARQRMTSVYRDKSFNVQGDSVMLEEKLEQVNDLKTQIRCLINDNEEIKLNQEELNSSMGTISHQMSLIADALDKANGRGRTDIFRRVSRLSRNSFRQLKSPIVTTPPPPTPLTPKPLNTNIHLPLKRKASLEGIVKTLTSLAVSISTDDVKSTVNNEVEQRLLSEADRRGSGSSLPGRLIDKKLKRTNLMKRRESQAFLEGVRKIRGVHSNADSGNNSNDNT
eukprot:maker-scaffold204_size260821-snap-gene-1.42 protein:Tk07825 transcript:maker-scaffold204_size260821-snap-gene-1.42-mRNA-1 annotation:"transient receptor potential channel pyrexia"